jgi:hypothetical protein
LHLRSLFVMEFEVVVNGELQICGQCFTVYYTGVVLEEMKKHYNFHVRYSAFEENSNRCGILSPHQPTGCLLVYTYGTLPLHQNTEHF